MQFLKYSSLDSLIRSQNIEIWYLESKQIEQSG